MINRNTYSFVREKYGKELVGIFSYDMINHIHKIINAHNLNIWIDTAIYFDLNVNKLSSCSAHLRVICF